MEDKKTQTGNSQQQEMLNNVPRRPGYRDKWNAFVSECLEESDRRMIRPSCVKYGRGPSSWQRLSRVSQWCDWSYLD